MPLTLLENGQLNLASIVFATDFSAASANAGRYAAAIASHFAAELVVTHSFILSQSAQEVERLHQKTSAERIEHVHRLKSAAAGFSAHNFRVRTQLLDGDPSDTIATFADAIPHSLLVLGTHGGSNLGRRIIGSVAERTLRRVAAPTITVGPNVPEPDVSRPFPCMLYATDASAMASRAAPFACAMAGSFSSELKVISIVDDKDGLAPDVLADLDFRTRQEIARQLPGACDHFTESRAVAKAGSARDEILHYAADARSSLLILGVHRRATIELFDRNSVTIQLIVRASCPVLTVTRGNASENPA